MEFSLTKPAALQESEKSRQKELTSSHPTTATIFCSCHSNEKKDFKKKIQLISCMACKQKSQIFFHKPKITKHHL